MTEEKFHFTSSIKKKIFITAFVGIVFLMLGVFLLNFGDDRHHNEHELVNDSEHITGEESHEGANFSEHTKAESQHGSSEQHGSPMWLKRLYSNLWVSNIYFTGLAIIGVFFFAVQYAAQAGWSAGIKRIPEAFGSWLPYAGVLMLIIFLFGGHDMFHWTHSYIYEEGPGYDAIIDGKKGYFFWLSGGSDLPVFYLLRMILFFSIWYIMFMLLRKESLKEDQIGGTASWHRMVFLSAVFIIIFAVSSSIAAWDWVMSIDTHWFSTMTGWYVFASWFVTGLAFTTYVVITLKENGYLKIVNSNHIHDLGKFVFGFSIFWAYIWFSQFMLIYYANIPEETVYFVERLSRSNYSWVFFLNLIANFFFPFLLLMPRDSKRQNIILKLVTVIVMIGHWFDFYLMITPGILKENGGFGFMEIGTFLIIGSAFVFIVLKSLAKAPLIAKNHPMLEESLHHHI